MQVLDDIWASIKGNIKTRINDPIIGAFVVSWALCNWSILLLLFFGTEKLEVRVKNISLDIGVLNEPLLILTNPSIFILPFVLTIIYIFFLPALAHKIEVKLRPIHISRHDHTVDLDLNKAIKQKELNKARLRANPNNEFLAKELEIDIDKEKSEAEQSRANAETAKNLQAESKAKAELSKTNAQIARNEQTESEAKANAAEIDLKKRKTQAATEQRTLAISTEKQKAELASHRFPSAYLFIELLSESAKSDDVVIPLSILTSSFAILFGYSDFNALLRDKNFTNENLESMEYVLLDSDRLTSEFSDLLDEEGIESYDSEWLIGHLEIVFDSLPYKLIYPETLAEDIREEIDCTSSDLLQNEGLSAGMADANAYFEEVDEIILGDYGYDDDNEVFIVKLNGSASGAHRKEHDMPGPGIDIFIEASCRAIIGRYGLQEHYIRANASVMNY